MTLFNLLLANKGRINIGTLSSGTILLSVSMNGQIDQRQLTKEMLRAMDSSLEIELVIQMMENCVKKEKEANNPF